uniref:G-protein coupled receptors family 2 profile 2 domain-containing protein n=1 Tax=Esox lucius TaxID=8010 RepID=A0A3P8XHH6_ESOLU
MENVCILSVGENRTTSEKCNLQFNITLRKKTNSSLITLNKTDINHKQDVKLCFPRQKATYYPPTGCSTGCSNMNETTCGVGSPYNQVNCKDTTDRFVIDPNQALCWTCVNPVRMPDVNISLPSSHLQISNGMINAASASVAMKNLSSLLNLMGNASSAAVSLGDVKGIISKLDKGNTKNLSFGLSSTNGLSIVANQGALTTNFNRSVTMPKESSDQAVQKNGTFVGVLVFPSMSQDEKKSNVLNGEVFGIEMGVPIANLTDPILIQYENVNKVNETLHYITGSSMEQYAFKKSYAQMFFLHRRDLMHIVILGMEKVFHFFVFFHFNLQNKLSSTSNRKPLEYCFLSGNLPNWTIDGCQTVEGENSITCQCTHLSFFAILLSPAPKNISSSDVTSLTYISYIGCGLSMFFLGVALFMHCAMSHTKSSQATKILINLFVALFILNLTFLINQTIANLGSYVPCVIVAAVMHYSMLSTFTWFLIEAIHLFLQLKKPNADTKHCMIKIYIEGWVLPAVVVIVLLGLSKYKLISINTNDGNPVNMCWINDVNIVYGVNIGYYACVFVCTMTIFIIVMRHIFMMTKTKASVGRQDSASNNTLTIVGLLFLLGITWGFAFFSFGPLTIPSYYIFSILNSFQGFFLFLYYYNSNKIIGDDRTSFTNETTSTSSNIYDNRPVNFTYVDQNLHLKK